MSAGCPSLPGRTLSRYVVLSLLLVAFLVGSTSGFVTVRLESYDDPPAHWATANLPLATRINTNGSADIGDTSDRDAIILAQETWGAVNTSFFEFDIPQISTATAANAEDGVNSIFFDNSGAVFGPGDSTVAITLLSISAATGLVSDADLVFNDQHPFSTATPTPAGSFDVRTVAFHEEGHMQGLDHSGVLIASMFPVVADGARYGRSPRMDDLVGVSTLYPEMVAGTGLQGLQVGDADWGQVSGTISGTAETTSGIPVPGVQVVAIDANGITVAADVSRLDGSYEIPGLPPSDYQLYGEPIDNIFSEQYITPGAYTNAFLPFRTTFLGGNLTPATLTLGAGDTLSGNVLDLGSLFGEEVESNDTAGAANPLPFEVLASGVVNPAGDVDYFSFAATSGDIVNIDVDASADGFPMDSLLTLFSTNGVTVLAENDDFPGKGFDSRLVEQMPGNGIYKARIADLAGNGGTGFFYTAHINKAVPETESNDTIGTADPAFIGQHRGGIISSGSDIDFYSFTADFGDRILAEVTAYQMGTGSPLDPFLVLYDSFGAIIASNDDINAGTGNLDSFLEYTFTAGVPGTFYVSVQHSLAPIFPVGPDAFYSLHLATDTPDLFYSALSPAGTGVSGFSTSTEFPEFVPQDSTFDFAVAGFGIPSSGQTLQVSGSGVSTFPTSNDFGTNSFGVDFFSQNVVVAAGAVPGPRSVFLQDAGGTKAALTGGLVIERNTAPPEVEQVRSTQDEVLSWDLVSGVGVELYNAYRINASALVDLNADGVSENYGSALGCYLPMPAFSDPAVPNLDEAFLYLFTGVSPLGEGTLGFTRTEAGPGLERPHSALALQCPPL